jgi:hypothetical protein
LEWTAARFSFKKRRVIDTRKFAKRLREAGFSEPQAEAVVATVQEETAGAEFGTKPDLEAATVTLRTELNIAAAALRSQIREAELRLEAKIEAMKAEILNRVFSLILVTLVVNIVAMLGVAKLLGH